MNFNNNNKKKKKSEKLSAKTLPAELNSALKYQNFYEKKSELLDKKSEFQNFFFWQDRLRYDRKQDESERSDTQQSARRQNSNSEPLQRGRPRQLLS